MSDNIDSAAMLIDQVNRLLTARLDRGTRRAAEGGQWPASLWQACEEIGLPLLLVPESAGGVGMGWVCAQAAFKLFGYHALPLPVGETMIAARLLAEADIAIPTGPLTFASAQETDVVPWARNAGHIVLLGDGRIELRRLDKAAIEIGANIGGDPRDKVATADLELLAVGNLAGGDRDLVMRLGAMLRGAQIAGALAAIGAMAIEYANTRHQFGRPLGKFQAVQQSLAVLACEAAAAEVAARMPALALDKGVGAEFEVAVAKVRAGEAAGIGAAIAHQVHGAIGFTDEHVLHDYTRRLWSWRSEFGSERYWAARLGLTAAAAGEKLFAVIVDPLEANHG